MSADFRCHRCVDCAMDDACVYVRLKRAEAENERLRGWLAVAAENMTYPHVQAELESALADTSKQVPKEGFR